MSKLLETFDTYTLSRGEVIALKKACAEAEALVGEAEASAQSARVEAEVKVERAKREAEAAAARDIHEAVARLDLARADLGVVRRNLKRAKAVMVQASNDLPRILHSDMAGVVGKQEAEAEPVPSAEARA